MNRLLTLTTRLLVAATLLFPLAVESAQAKIEDPDRIRAYQIVDKAKATVAGSVSDQAEVLVSLAWPDDEFDPMVSFVAREQIVHFGAEGLQALRLAIPRVQPHYQFDVLATLMEAKAGISGGIPAEYLPAIEDAIWFGSLEAKRLAIPEAARYRYPLAVLTIMDAAIEHPQLMAIAAQSLGDFRNPRARKFLLNVMKTGHPYERLLSARALGRIGSQGMLTLREAARDTGDDPGCRSAAIQTLLPVTTDQDLSLLHEYIGLYPDENPTLFRMVMQRAILLESIREKQAEAEAASPD